MPRVANPPRANGRTTSKQTAAATPRKSPIKIPLNDDRQEKAVRLQSRQALHEVQMNQIKAAATPIRKLQNMERANSTSPKTPYGVGGRGKENEGDGMLSVVGGTAVTPLKRVPLLANFEEWMKMATDNKINATNSWNFALIDYFHDMSLLKEGDGVNFQKASCTLDGCVKIYTSRVDSVATETGKLLSGLADGGSKKRRGGEEEGEEGEEGDEEVEGEDGLKKRVKKRVSGWSLDYHELGTVLTVTQAQRSSEATLAPSFAPLQLKKFELEFSVDPLFKKASADFDEGGAKGLLLNHLAIDAQGRIVFDSSDDAGDATAEGENRRRKSGAVDEEHEVLDRETSPMEAGESEVEDLEIDIESLGLKYFPNLDLLDDQDVCPSLKNLDLGDPAGSLDIPFLKAPEDWRQEKDQDQNVGDRSGIFLDDENAAGFDDDDGTLGGFNIPADTGFGEGGEAWARDAAIEPQKRVYDGGFGDDVGEGGGGEGEGEGMEVGSLDVKNGDYVVSLKHDRTEGGHEDILSYFDQALRKNWAGPEHWRIRKIKDVNKPSAPATSKRKEKEPFEIDFASPIDPALAELIYTPASSNAAISLPKAQWKSKTRNLLPDDKHFNSRSLLRLFLKPKARMGTRRPGGSKVQSNKVEEIPEGEMDEAFWARKQDPAAIDTEEAPQGDYDANFFQDDGLALPGGVADDDDEDFADAREDFSPGADGVVGTANGINDVLAASQEGAFGSQLVTQNRRLRPEYVQYARVAKKVDVRRLKEEMWRGIGLKDETPTQTPSKPTEPPIPDPGNAPLKFTSVMNNLQSVYPKQAMADISTSYCFICLLHLANEKGLELGNDEGLEELSIRKDLTAEITEGAE
ncbi:MAG: hypothetical protein M1812_004677 [Candelaria pacifica]|nr:MAG: hypothetical protein M1812_004677 [Candelaria pacifica]